MKRLTVLFMASVLAGISCSTKRHLQTDASQHRETRLYRLREVGLMQADTLQEIRLQRNDDQLEALAISPVGAFRYHPDSGFIGEARQVLLYRKRSAREDSLHRVGGRLVSRSVQTVSDSSQAETQQQVTEQSAHHSGLGWPWWTAGMPLLLLALSVWILRKRSGP